MQSVESAAAAESPAIEALGTLFKISEVFLWDDAMIDASKAFARPNFEEESTISFIPGEINSSNKHTVDDYTSVEDIELAQQMGALGLPTSFRTTKEHNNNVANRGKRKGTRVKYVTADKDIENRVLRALRPCILEDNASSRVLYDSTNLLDCTKIVEGNTGPSYPDSDQNQDRQGVDCETDVTMSNCVEDGLGPGECDLDADLSTEASKGANPENIQGNDFEEAKSIVQHKEELLHKQRKGSYLEGSSICCYSSGGDDVDDDDGGLKLADQPVPDYLDDSICFEFGEWRVIWDPFYKRYYFYNSQSRESTWYPPQGLEHFAFSSSTSNSNEVFTDEIHENAGVEFVSDAIQDIGLHCSHEIGDSFGYLNHSSEELNSSRMINKITLTCGAEQSDECRNAEEITNERGLLHVPEIMGHTTNDLDVDKYWEEQEKHVTFAEACNLSNGTNSLTATYNGVGYNEAKSISADTSVKFAMDELQNFLEVSDMKKKKRVRRHQSQISFQGADVGFSESVIKYWCQRYLLFSRFDSGILMDEEGWFSVTPESIARHHASRCGSGTIIDCFTGVGGNAIQFAMRSNHVIAIDIDPQKIDYAQHNAAIYGVSDKINFIKGDFFQLAPCLKGNVIFLSPPWGGPDYNKVQTYDIRSMLKPQDGQYLFKVATMIASKILMFLPRNIDLNQLAELSMSVDPPWALEVEKNFLNGKLKAITAYFDSPVCHR